MYRKVPLLLMVAIAVTLAAATIAGAKQEYTPGFYACKDASGQPVYNVKQKDTGKYTDCVKQGPDYQPTAAPPPPPPPENNAEAERACRDVYQGTFIPPDSCEFTETDGNSVAFLEGGRVQLRFNGHWIYTWDAEGFLTTKLLDYEPVSCIDTWNNLRLDYTTDPRCQYPTG